MEKISVIIPVYNTMEKLEICVKSVMAQTFQDYEIILVDDGSTDESGAICDKLAKENELIKTYHKVNGGVSSARNVGIEKATGKFISFVDSDDIIVPNYLELLYKNIKGVELSMGAMEINGKLAEIKDGTFTLKAFKRNISVWYKGQYLNSPCNKLFVTDIIQKNNLQFDPKIQMAEDNLFVMAYVLHCKKIKCFSDLLYIYKNTSKKYLDKFLYDVLYVSKVKDEILGEKTTHNVFLKVFSLREKMSAIEWNVGALPRHEKLEVTLEKLVLENDIMQRVKKIHLPKFITKKVFLWLWLLEKQDYKTYVDKFVVKCF